MALDSKSFLTCFIKNKSFNYVDFIDAFFLVFYSFYEYLAAFGIAQASLALLSLARYFLVMAK